eukprot:1146695-Pelagomonas_calceolata.AAC.7
MHPSDQIFSWHSESHLKAHALCSCGKTQLTDLLFIKGLWCSKDQLPSGGAAEVQPPNQTGTANLIALWCSKAQLLPNIHTLQAGFRRSAQGSAVESISILEAVPAAALRPACAAVQVSNLTSDDITSSKIAHPSTRLTFHMPQA